VGSKAAVDSRPAACLVYSPEQTQCRQRRSAATGQRQTSLDHLAALIKMDALPADLASLLP
jgi:hypothetical protein